ncbi:MAG TPA: vitamin K epoxide reductase family protein [Miltoncostaeaceae bacterium]|nr:vitamin K epoxide reductase family protein [Miltoncostaeaceae bacterium]
MTVSSPPVRPRPEGRAAPSGARDLERWLGVLLLVAGLVGLGAAAELAIEKFRLLENPLYVPACSLGEVVDCVSVMRSEQSEAFGFPNPFIGLAGFGALTTTGLVLLTGGRLARGFCLVLQAGLLFGVVFVHWLIFQTLYRIGALCPFCMAVWAVTIPAFWYVTLYNSRGLSGRPGAIAAALRRNHGILVTVWLLAVAALVVERFWAPWDSIFL